MSRPAYIAKYVKRPATPGPAKRQREREKREAMRAELEAVMRPPLNHDTRLTKREVRQVEEKVRRGLFGQSFHAIGGGAGTRTVEP